MENIKTDEFSSVQIIALIVRHKWFVISLTILSTIVAAIISFLVLENEYKSTVNVVPPQSTDALQGSMGMISSALKDFGLNKLAGKASSDNYNFMVILTSRSVLDSIIIEFDLVKIYKTDDGSIEDTRKQLESNIEITYEKDGNYLISVWDKDKSRAALIANRIVEIANNVAVRVFREETRLNKENMEYRLAKTDSTIHAIADTLHKFSRRTLMFSPTDQAAAISKALSDLKSEEVKSDIMYEYYKNIYGESDYMTKAFSTIKDETRKKTLDATNNTGFAGNFSIKDAGKEGIEFFRLYTEFETYSKVKAFILPMIEQTRLDETKKIKNLIVVDPAKIAEKKDRPKRSLIVAGTAVGSFVLAVFILLVIYSVNNLKHRLNNLKNEQ